MNEYMKILGYRVIDSVTGFEGVVTTVGFDLYGCVQCVVTPAVPKDGKYGDSVWFDHKRLTITGKKPVLDVPLFGSAPKTEAGPQSKPSMSGNPLPR